MRKYAALSYGRRMQSGLCLCISWMKNATASINITFRNLAQTCSPYLDVHYSFGVQKKKSQSNLNFNHQNYIYIYIKQLNLEISLWFSLEFFLFLPDGLSYCGSLIREICHIKEKNKARDSGP